MQVTVSAPGKIHLIGEHVAVYGYPALLTTINKRVYITIKSRKKGGVAIQTGEDKKFIYHSIDIFQKKFALTKLSPIEIIINSQIPIGSGMGSSAAVTAALMGALMRSMKNIWNPQMINELAYEVEKYTHGNPSGADNSIAVFGGLVWYRKEFDFLKSIWSLPVIKYHIPQLYVIDSGKPVESTKDMVRRVGQVYKKNSKAMDFIFLDQQIQTKKLLLALKNKNEKDMQEVFYQAEKNLECMGAVGRFAQQIIRMIEKNGGVAKISGAGGLKKGSGMIICYNTTQALLKKIKDKFHVLFFPIICGEEGIRLESYSSKT